MYRYKSILYLLLVLAAFTAAFSIGVWDEYIPRVIVRMRWYNHPKDWLIHALLYGCGNLLFLLAMRNWFPPGTMWRRRLIWWIPIGFLLLGAADETAQGLIEVHRTPDVHDWLFDLLGVVVTTSLIRWQEDRWRAHGDPLAIAPASSLWTVKRAARLVVRLHGEALATTFGRAPVLDVAVESLLNTSSAEDLARVLQWSHQSELGLIHWRRRPSTDATRIDAVRELCRTEIHFQHSLDLRREAALGQLLQRWQAAGVEVAPYKGPYLAHTLGQPPGTRPCGDLDFFLSPDMREAAVKVLEADGARPITTDPVALEYMQSVAHEYSMDHPALGRIELHTRLYSDLAAEALPNLWARCAKDQYLAVDVRRFDPNDLYVMLSQHMMQQGWTTGMKWVVDLLYFHLAFEAAAEAPPAHPTIPVGLQGVDPASLTRAAVALDGVFPLLAGQAIVAHLLGRSLPVVATAALRAELTAIEREALAWIESPAGLDLSADVIVLAARRSRRRKRAQPLRPSLVPHPGRIAMELGVRSDDPRFPRLRRGWKWRRVWRGIAAACGWNRGSRHRPYALITPPAPVTPLTHVSEAP